MTIIDRLSKLDGADREVDRQIHAYFGLPFSEVLCDKPFLYNAYTASVDAAIALAERVLPGWDWGKDDNGFMYLYQPDTDDCISVQAASPAIALCIAILRAKEGSKL
ncbi:hypothetical protein [Brucella pseudogrignonensis]|uniref:Phage ABA sandwich domain-containing protein n=1 Tax=Brucella pseudogrignonensis TaxID=419475 RepID=A0ABU1M4V0_9HYPH|nr:hypothetical protein [Brucella pseudogrignonensis]MDR6431066.1 hypothetical protein [Brucella pseudogrignonensis]